MASASEPQSPTPTLPHPAGSTSTNGAPDNASAVAGDSTREATTSLYDQPWITSFLRPTLIALLAVALVIALLAFIRRFVPGLPPVYTQLLVSLGLITAIIGCITTSWLAQPAQRNRRNIGYRAAELALILGIARLTIWFATGWPDPMTILLRPLDSLLDGYFLVALFVVFIAWVMATSMTDDLMSLALQPDDLYMARTFNDRWQDTARPVYTDRGAILRRFTARWVVGGVFLVILAAGSRFNLPEKGFLGIIRQNIDPQVILAIIVYFLVGLVLISQGQLALLRARWTLQKTPSAGSVMRNWPIYSLFMIAAIGLFAALMPLGGTFWLAVIISSVLQFMYNALFAVFRFIMGLFLLLVSLLTGEQTEQAAPEQPPIPQMTPEALPPPTTEIPPWLGGAAFWIVIALLLGYAAYIYFSGKGFTFAWLRQLWQMLRLRWLSLFGAYRQWQRAIRRAAEQSPAENGKPRRSLLSWLLPRNLTPEQRVRYYYLSTLEAAQEAGIPRRNNETPLHYAPRLAAYMQPTAQDPQATPSASAQNITHDPTQEVHTLTEAFVRVRYAGAPTEEEQIPVLKQIWNHLKRLLRVKTT